MFTQRELDVLKRGYGRGEEVGARLVRGDEMAIAPVKGYDGIFESQLKCRLRFLIFHLLQEVIEYYGVLITQLLPSRLCRIVAFTLACKEAKVESSSSLFRHYYHIKRTEGFYYVCGRSLSKYFLAKIWGPQADGERGILRLKSQIFQKK